MFIPSIIDEGTRAAFFAVSPEPPCLADHRRHQPTTMSRGLQSPQAFVASEWREAIDSPILPEADRWGF